MDQYLNQHRIINEFYNGFIQHVESVDESDINKYAWICGWSDKYNQYKRFEILTQIGIKNTDSVLDIGCGCGEFMSYCKENNLKINYAGIDINQNYLDIAQARYPKSIFIKSNGWDLVLTDFDWAIASGVFTVVVDITHVLWYVGFVLEQIVKKGFAFNLLNYNAPEGLGRYNSEAVLKALVDRFPEYNIEIIDGYLPDDFTVYIKK